jgi:hypothetical protein
MRHWQIKATATYGTGFYAEVEAETITDAMDKAMAEIREVKKDTDLARIEIVEVKP